MTDTFSKPLKDETYIVAREDLWILRIMVDDSRYCLIKFWILYDKAE